MTRFFTEQAAALRYETYRPKTHGEILLWLDECEPDRRFTNAIDIACGTGDSTLPLRQIADRVIGIDASAAMLHHARNKGLDVTQDLLEDLAARDQYDLVTTCMAYHWFEPDVALRKFKQISAPNAIWLIYNFYFAGHGSSNEFNHWLRHSYLKQYPTPPRHRPDHVMPGDDAEIMMVRENQGLININLSAEQLAGYLTTQSNVEEAVKSGGDYINIGADLLKQISELDVDESFLYGFTYGVYRYLGGHSSQAAMAP